MRNQIQIRVWSVHFLKYNVLHRLGQGSPFNQQRSQKKRKEIQLGPLCEVHTQDAPMHSQKNMASVMCGAEWTVVGGQRVCYSLRCLRLSICFCSTEKGTATCSIAPGDSMLQSIITRYVCWCMRSAQGAWLIKKQCNRTPRQTGLFFNHQLKN